MILTFEALVCILTELVHFFCSGVKDSKFSINRISTSLYGCY